jgi:archaellum component FlaC
MDFDEKNIGHRAISPEDQKMRDHIVKVYKQLFGFKQIDHFTVDQVKALHDVNKSIVKTDNQYISIPNLKKAYEKLGENLEQLEKQYKDLVNEGRDMRDRSSDRFNDWKERVTLVENQLSKVKDLFSKCNLVIEGVRNANLSIKADELKAQNPVKSMDMSMDISQ